MQPAALQRGGDVVRGVPVPRAPHDPKQVPVDPASERWRARARTVAGTVARALGGGGRGSLYGTGPKLFTHISSEEGGECVK